MSTTLKIRISDLLKKSVGLPGSNDNCCQLPAADTDSAPAPKASSGGCCSATVAAARGSSAAPDKGCEGEASS